MGLSWTKHTQNVRYFWKFSGKIWFFQNPLNSICTTMRTTCGHNFSSIWCCWWELLFPPPAKKSVQCNPEPKKTLLFFLSKVETNKHPETKTWGGNFLTWAQKSNFARILWFFWSLGLILFDTFKDAVFPETLVLSNNFGFPEVNWVPKWTRTVKFGCIPFETKFKISKDFSNTVFVFLEDYLCSKSQQHRTIFGGVRPKSTQKGTISLLLNQYQKPWKFLTSQTQMLYWWNLRQIYILSSFICQNVGVYLIGCKRKYTKKTSQNGTKNHLFDLVLTISLYFNKKCSKFDASLCMSSLVKISNKINIIGSSGQKTTKEQPKMKKHLKI